MRGENLQMIKFTASLPDIDSAIKINGGGNGARVQLSVPQSDVMAVLKMSQLAGMVFSVTVEACEGDD